MSAQLRLGQGLWKDGIPAFRRQRDDNGNLHKFTGAFRGTPAEAGAPWPVNLSATSKLSSPVYDGVTGYVIVGDFAGVLHSVTAATGAIHGTANTTGDAIADAPLVDSTAGKLYAFVTTVGTHNEVYELPTNFTTNAGAGTEPIGTGGARDYLYAGTFDNVYYSSATFTGNLYAIGNTGAAGANLYRIPIATSTMSLPVTVVTGLNGGGALGWPSPVNEFCNNGLSACTANATQTTAGIDYIFFSVYHGNKAGCTNAAGSGCVLSYNVSIPAGVGGGIQAGSGLPVITPGAPGCWATGGIVIDNSVPTGTFAGASQIYFLGLGANTAGGSTGVTSTNCAPTTAGTISATQALQSSP